MTPCTHKESKRVCMHPDGVHIWWCPECGALKGGNTGGWLLSALANRPVHTAPNGMQFVEDEHAVVPTLIDVASWGLKS